MSNNTNTQKSALEKFTLYYEHTDDNRLIVDKQNRPVKRLKRNIATRR